MKYLQIAKIVVIVLCIVLVLGAASMLAVSANVKLENFFTDLFGGVETDAGTGSETEGQPNDSVETLPGNENLNSECVHEFDDGVTFKEATCVSSGVVKYTCSNCTGIKYESIPAPGHDWDDGKITVQGSCKVKQEVTYTCDRCGSTNKLVNTEVHPSDSRQEVVTAFSELKHEIATHCLACKKVLKREIVPHSWNDGEVTVQPTCNDGEMLYKCVCGATKTVVIAGVGHDIEYSYDIESETKHSVTKTCTICNQVISTGQTESHSWSNDKCVKCGAER